MIEQTQCANWESKRTARTGFAPLARKLLCPHPAVLVWVGLRRWQRSKMSKLGVELSALYPLEHRKEADFTRFLMWSHNCTPGKQERLSRAAVRLSMEEHANMEAAAGAIDEYLLQRLKPVEGAIPQLPGIEMYGNSIPAGTVGGDLFEYLNFQQRYDIDARIRRALRLSGDFLHPHSPGTHEYNSVDELIEWFQSRPDYDAAMEAAYRRARSLEQVRVADDLNDLYTTAGVLLVDAQGHGVISAKIASTVHDTFHAFMLAELDRYGKTTPDLFEQLNIRLAHSVTARNALGRSENETGREIATMLYGEVRPSGHFRFVNFGHPPPLLFSAKRRRFIEIDRGRMVRFLPLGLEVPEDHPDRKRYLSMHFRQRPVGYSDVAEITLIHPGDILFLYTDGVYDGSDEEVRRDLELMMEEYCGRPAKDICNAVLEYAVRRDVTLRDSGEPDLIDDKTAFVIQRSAAA